MHILCLEIQVSRQCFLNHHKMKIPAVYLRYSVILYFLLFSLWWANGRWCLTSEGPAPSLTNSILLLSNAEGEKKNWEKMFQCLCLTGKINCTYKIQITLFNLKMIGPGLSPRAWSVGWCMALVYSSTANPTVLCRPPGQSWEGRDVHTTMEPEDV